MKEPVAFLNCRVSLYGGDCRDVLKSLPDCSIDAVVTDPPYALTARSRNGSPRTNNPATSFGRTAIGVKGFMGKQWDTGETAFCDQFWAEVFRVLKPGGHVAAFSGTRTYHRMAVAIEDAGFEISDQIGWTYRQRLPQIAQHWKRIWHRAQAGMGTNLRCT
jgi:site-specific DNA-methyltransferase (adenine-specific)